MGIKKRKMIGVSCQECPFNNSCAPYTQISEKYKCNYLSDFEVIKYGSGRNNDAIWTGVSYRRYAQTSRQHPLDVEDIDKDR